MHLAKTEKKIQIVALCKNNSRFDYLIVTIDLVP